MPLFNFHVDISGMQRRFAALIDSTQGEALDKALLRTGGFVRARTKREVFATEGNGKWPALAPSTLARKMNDAEVSLLVGTKHSAVKGEGKSKAHYIVREAAALEKSKAREAMLRKRLADLSARGRKTAATERSIAIATSRQRNAETYLRAHRANAVAAGIGSSQAALIAYAQREVERAKAHGQILRAYKEAQKQGHKFSDAERRALLRKHTRRYRASEASTRILGGLENTLALKLAPGRRIDVFSKAYIGGIHNAGGTAGHGAKIPAREFMFLTDRDLQFLAELLREQMISAWYGESAASSALVEANQGAAA